VPDCALRRVAGTFVDLIGYSGLFMLSLAEEFGNQIRRCLKIRRHAYFLSGKHRMDMPLPSKKNWLILGVRSENCHAP
jgi:hypothetical protein